MANILGASCESDALGSSGGSEENLLFLPTDHPPAPMAELDAASSHAATSVAMINTVTLTISEFLENFNVSIDCVITHCNTAFTGKTPLQRGCKVLSVDGETVSTVTDLRSMLSKHANEDDHVTIDFADKRASMSGSRGFDPDALEEEEKHEQTPLEQMQDIARRSTPEKCIVIFCHGDDAMPRALLLRVADINGVRMQVFDAGVTLHRRPRQEQLIEAFKTQLGYGDWILIVNATKSLSVLRCLVDVLKEMTSGDQGAIHYNSRIFILGEPHPHFPRSILDNGTVLRYSNTQDTEQLQTGYESLRESRRKISSTTGGSFAELPPSRRVRMDSNLDIVTFESEMQTEGMMSTSLQMEEMNPGGEPIPHEVRCESRGLVGEKFTSMSWAGEGRMAAGSSGGNVYVMERSGKHLLTFHAHGGSVWDLDFCNRSEFVSASEDASLTEWVHDPTHAIHGFSGKIISRFSNDAMAIKYADPTNPAVVVGGGLNGSLVFLNKATGSRQVVPTVSTILCLSRLGGTNRNRMLMGGGTGFVTLWDSDTGTAVSTYFHHKQKVACVSGEGNLIVSGSADRTITLSEGRSKQLSMKIQNLSGTVTALSVGTNYISACAGEVLTIYDIRKPHTLLWRKPNAWRGVARSVLFDTTSGTLPIAIVGSSDGVIRFFGCT